MSIQRLRSLAASKQFLAACLCTIAVYLLSSISIYFLLFDTTMSMLAFSELSLDEQTLQIVNTSLLVLYLITIVFVLGVASLPVIGQLMIYSNARKQAPMKTAGFSLLKGYLLASCIIGGFGVFGGVIQLLIGFSYNAVSDMAVACVNLAVLIMSYNAVTAGRDVVRYGYTRRRISQALPVLMIVSVCISIGDIIWSVLEQFGVLPTGASPIATPAFLLAVLCSLAGIVPYLLYYRLVVKARDLFASSQPPVQYTGIPTDYQPPENPWTNGSDHGPL